MIKKQIQSALSPSFLLKKINQKKRLRAIPQLKEVSPDLKKWDKGQIKSLPTKKREMDLRVVLNKEKSVRSSVNYNEYSLCMSQYAACFLKSVGLAATISFLFYRSIFLFLVLLLPISIFMIRKSIKDHIKNRKRKLKTEFKDALLAISQALAAGYSVENSFVNAYQELGLLYSQESIMVKELKLIIGTLTLNGSLEDGVTDLAMRSGLEDIHNFSQVFSIAKRSGGNLVQIMKETAAAIEEKVNIEEDIHTMLRQKKLDQSIMNFMPIGIVFYIQFTSPGYFSNMQTLPIGKLIITICLLVYGAAFLLATKISRIEV